jgi:hypothetical protein
MSSTVTAQTTGSKAVGALRTQAISSSGRSSLRASGVAARLRAAGAALGPALRSAPPTWSSSSSPTCQCCLQRCSRTQSGGPPPCGDACLQAWCLACWKMRTGRKNIEQVEAILATQEQRLPAEHATAAPQPGAAPPSVAGPLDRPAQPRAPLHAHRAAAIPVRGAGDAAAQAHRGGELRAVRQTCSACLALHPLQEAAGLPLSAVQAAPACPLQRPPPMPRPQVKLEQDLALRVLEEQASRGFRANPVPPAVTQPRYQQLLEEQEARRRESHARNTALLASMQRPFTFHLRRAAPALPAAAGVALLVYLAPCMPACLPLTSKAQPVTPWRPGASLCRDLDRQARLHEERLRAQDPARFQQRFRAGQVPPHVREERFAAMSAAEQVRCRAGRVQQPGGSGTLAARAAMRLCAGGPSAREPGRCCTGTHPAPLPPCPGAAAGGAHPRGAGARGGGAEAAAGNRGQVRRSCAAAGCELRPGLPALQPWRADAQDYTPTQPTSPHPTPAWQVQQGRRGVQAAPPGRRQLPQQQRPQPQPQHQHQPGPRPAPPWHRQLPQHQRQRQRQPQPAPQPPGAGLCPAAQPLGGAAVRHQGGQHPQGDRAAGESRPANTRDAGGVSADCCTGPGVRGRPRHGSTQLPTGPLTSSAAATLRSFRSTAPPQRSRRPGSSARRSAGAGCWTRSPCTLSRGGSSAGPTPAAGPA